MDDVKCAERLLGVRREATDNEIRRAFRRLAKKLHPDAGGDAKAFGDLCNAYTVAMNRSTSTAEVSSRQAASPAPAPKSRVHRPRTFADVLNTELGYV